MTQIDIQPYQASDLQTMEVREHELIVLQADALLALLDECMSITAWAQDVKTKENIPVAVLAYKHTAPGFIEVFVIPSVYLPSVAFSFVRTILRYLDRLEQDIPEFRRMETRSLADEQTDRWMKALGFTQEGVHPKYAPDGSTYNSWARVK